MTKQHNEYHVQSRSANLPKDAGLYKVTKNDENCFQVLAKPLAEMKIGEGQCLGRNVRALNGVKSTRYVLYPDLVGSYTDVYM